MIYNFGTCTESVAEMLADMLTDHHEALGEYQHQKRIHLAARQQASINTLVTALELMGCEVSDEHVTTIPARLRPPQAPEISPRPARRWRGRTPSC